MHEGKARGQGELFLDTTYILPFFQVPLRIRGFTPSEFKALIRNLSEVHVGEISVYEAKAKLLRLSKASRTYEKALRGFGENLSILRSDEKFVFHEYTGQADERFNQLLPFAKQLDAFDLIILGQAFAIGRLLTEDHEILALRDSDEFVNSPLSKGISIKCWKDRS